MITEAFFIVVISLLNFVFGWIPQVTELPDWYVNGGQVFVQGLVFVKALPIVGTMLSILLTWLIFMSGWQTITFVNMIFNKIRGSG